MDEKKYFYRVVPFSRNGDQVALVDALNPSVDTPLEAWLGTVISLADGQHRLEELKAFLAGRYPGGAPTNFDETLESAVERLLDSKALMLADEPVKLPYYLALPVNEQDKEKARQLMLEDGYIQH